MKYLLIATLMCMCLAVNWNVLAQQRADDSPATQQDVEKYLQAIHTEDTLKQMVEAMSKPMHKLVHDQFVKEKDKLPRDFEVRINKTMDNMLKDFPLDEMMEAMVKVYQKHFTEGDIEVLLAFYTAPTGQKLLREMPKINDEAMSSITPIMRENMDAMMERIQQDVAKELQESPQNFSRQNQ